MQNRIFLFLLSAVALFAQQQAPRPAAVTAPPKNLKVLRADDAVMDIMRDFNESLGVQCVYCHVQGDFASDEDRKSTRLNSSH